MANFGSVVVVLDLVAIKERDTVAVNLRNRARN